MPLEQTGTLARCGVPPFPTGKLGLIDRGTRIQRNFTLFLSLETVYSLPINLFPRPSAVILEILFATYRVQWRA
jgi:hypothetical protein